MEKYVRNVRFILICNYVGQIIPALQSRCTRFRFSPLPLGALKARVDDVAHSEGLVVEEEAVEAIIKLAGGDMRRILNVLQAAAAARPGPNASITEDAIYAVTAAPHPAALDRIFRTLLDQTDFTAALAVIRQLQISKGLALMDLLRAMFDRCAEIQLPDDMRIFLTRHLADVEFRLAKGSSESVQLLAMVGVFFASRSFLVVP